MNIPVMRKSDAAFKALTNFGFQAISLFNRHVRHNVSDHRPVWVELDTG